MSMSNTTKKHAEMIVLSKLQNNEITPSEASDLLKQVNNVQEGQISMEVDWDKGVVKVMREKVKGAPKYFTPEEIDQYTDYWIDELRSKGEKIRKNRGF